LDEDTLRAVLLRTGADDHPNLRSCCKKFNDVLNSSLFKKERSECGYAEVKVRLLSPEEQYTKWIRYMKESGRAYDEVDFQSDYDRLGRKDDFGSNYFFSKDIDVYVDGIPWHEKGGRRYELRVQLVPRRYPFLEACHIFGGLLSSLGITLFTNRGNPRVVSLKSALKTQQEISSNKAPMLYISKFEVPIEYRSPSSTVGPLIIQGVLKCFREDFSIAFYIPDGSTQFTQTEANIQEEIKRQEGFDALTLQDMRQFFRAGFSQVSDNNVVQQSDRYYVFITSSDADAMPSIRTEQEAFDTPIVMLPPPPPEKSGLAKELWDAIRGQCYMHSMALKTIKYLKRLETAFAEMKEYLEEMTDGYDFSSDLAMWHDYVNDWSEKGQRVVLKLWSTSDFPVMETEMGFSLFDDNIRELGHELSEFIKNCKLKLPTHEELRNNIMGEMQHIQKQKLAEMESKRDGIVKETHAKIKSIMDKAETDESRYELILNSDSFHACAAFMCFDFIEMILEYLHGSTKQLHEVVNHAAGNGVTPLMVFAFQFGKDFGEKGNFVEALHFAETLISLGAEKNMIQSKTGLSALGHFREGVRRSVIRSSMYGDLFPDPVDSSHDVPRFETLFTPDSGPTEADQEVFKAETQEADDEDDDESVEDDDQEDDEESDDNDEEQGDEDGDVIE
jgi:hypothetical protein